MKDSTNSTFLQQNETKIKLLFVIVVLILIAVQVYLSSWLIFKGDVYFNEDIARDFLIIEDIVTNHHITLIGPRTLAVGGLFHGPLWLYVNLPAYLLGHGNPVFMGEFWVFLYILYIGIVYYVARKLFDPTVGLLSALLLTSTSYMYFFNNTFGAVLLFPIYFYCFTRYLKTLKLRMLATVFFLNGLLIQFELAFGIPVLIISLLYLLYFLSKMKKLQHLLWLWIIFIPLSTYIIFDLRHNFIELHAIVQYIFSKKASLGSFFTFPFVYQRIVTITNSSLQFLNHNSLFLNVLFIGVCVYATYIIKKRKNVYYAQLFSSFVILYLGYWVITLFTKVTLWVWYYYEFTSVLVILFCATYRLMNRTIFIILFFLFYVIGLQAELTIYNNDKNTFSGRSSYSWQLYSQVAKSVYAQAPSQFGYYIYENDSLGYRTRYAMHYSQRESHKVGVENTKLPTTYLLIDSMSSMKWWKENRVHLAKNPSKKYSINGIYQIEGYALNKNETAVPSDPNLIDNLFFR